MDVRLIALTEDLHMLATLRRALDNVGVTMVICEDVDSLYELLNTGHYEGILIDADDVPGAMALQLELRQDRRCRTTVLFSVINGRTSVQSAFGMGATFVLEKPLTLDRAMRCFKAAYGIIVGERRRYYRHRVETLVDFESGGKKYVANAVDVSSGGMCVETPVTVPMESRVTVQLTLPDSNTKFTAICDVVWSGGSRIGLQFNQVGRKDRETLAKWLETRMEMESRKPQPPLSSTGTVPSYIM